MLDVFVASSRNQNIFLFCGGRVAGKPGIIFDIFKLSLTCVHLQTQLTLVSSEVKSSRFIVRLLFFQHSMVFFFHHYELPAILRREAHIVAEDQINEEQLELDLLNQTADNPNEPAHNNTYTDDDEINIEVNNGDENNFAENSSASIDPSLRNRRQNGGETMNGSQTLNVQPNPTSLEHDRTS